MAASTGDGTAVDAKQHAATGADRDLDGGVLHVYGRIHSRHTKTAVQQARAQRAPTDDYLAHAASSMHPRWPWIIHLRHGPESHTITSKEVWESEILESRSGACNIHLRDGADHGRHRVLGGHAITT